MTREVRFPVHVPVGPYTDDVSVGPTMETYTLEFDDAHQVVRHPTTDRQMTFQMYAELGVYFAHRWLRGLDERPGGWTE